MNDRAELRYWLALLIVAPVGLVVFDRVWSITVVAVGTIGIALIAWRRRAR